MMVRTTKLPAIAPTLGKVREPRGDVLPRDPGVHTVSLESRAVVDVAVVVVRLSV